ncbi:hypothetical protein [Antarcticirhabdus aurantiaca]|uniref:Uncharacterized protein n=1 Tax=Antarcticirhabdus aurantiaca TaxID=2606717 RepID=A0ACD4NK84_9HYPH|nr:hypothetical protein [Antarcticirhabdus aurantiaca]WAJ27167.1 hypothetical protein OXU80_20255 [Jeongeuplla avenae]
MVETRHLGSARIAYVRGRSGRTPRDEAFEAGTEMLDITRYAYVGRGLLAPRMAPPSF